MDIRENQPAPAGRLRPARDGLGWDHVAEGSVETGIGAVPSKRRCAGNDAPAPPPSPSAPNSAGGSTASAAVLHLTGRASDGVTADLDLLRAYRDGETAGFERLFLRHQGRLRALCLRHLRDDAAADDAVQETFLRLLRVADRLEDGFNVSAWLRRVATNVCMDELRRRCRLHVVDEEEPLLCGIPDAARALQPEAAYEIAEARAAVTQIARALPGRGGAALLLREVEGLSYLAIAGQLGISVGAVETLLFRARRRFAEEYLRLEGVAPTRCGMVRHVLEVIGRSHVGVHERRLVARHLRECSPCRHRSEELAAPVMLVDGGGEARMARSASRYGRRARVGAAG